MTNKQIKELQVLGFQISDEDVRYGVAVFSETIPELNVLKKLIFIMTFNDEIHYWDADRESPTDPGGYVTALRLDEERVAIWKEIMAGQVVGILYLLRRWRNIYKKNWDKDCDRGMYFNKVLIQQNKYITRERINKDYEIDKPQL
ncbi:MAG: hypothetical protein IJ327_02185 [Lachnospiraceae bacterium]|nr:hypothetical protein [Lachnospiraceae bacterium]